MSGGSWDYFYSKLEDVAVRLKCEDTPLRRAFGTHLIACSAALKAIEWSDSGDTEMGSDEALIEAALGKNKDALVLKEAIKSAQQARDELNDALRRAAPTPK